MLLANEVGVCWVSRKENAMAIVLEPKSSYNLISRAESSNNKLLMHVKLTDSCLRALEDYQLAEVSPRRKPSIKFSGYQGSILIPLGKADSGDENTAEFQLDCSAILSAGQQGGMDCIQQSGGSSDIRTLGAVTHKITVRATDDSYQMTQQRMKEAEEERKGISTKVINTPKKGSRKVFKGYKQTKNVMAAMKRQIKSGPGAKVSSGPSKTLRERVIHLLAVRHYKKPELISRLTKEGVNLKDRNSLTGILQQVAVMTDNQYRLLKHLYSEVQVETWPSYSETEKQILRRKIKTELNNSSVVTSSSPPKTKNSETSKPQSKRHRQSEAEHSAKRQRISHIKNNNNIVKDSLEKDAFQVEKSKLPEEKERERVEESVLDKKDENDEEEESISAENSLNGLNGLDSSDFTKKYKPITNYEQRCLYKKDFNAELPEYESLKAKVDSMKEKIHDLQSKRLQFPEGTAEREDLDKEIREHYHEMIKDPRWLPTTNRCQELHKKLSYIKRLIADYDKGAANT